MALLFLRAAMTSTLVDVMADRQHNPVAGQGAVMAMAGYDINTKQAVQLRNARVGASLYGGSETEQNWHIQPNELVFTVPGESNGDTKMRVLSSYNGFGADATSLYAGDPDAAAMVRETVKNQIQVVGAAYQYLSADRDSFSLGVAVQMGGLKTLPMGNNAFGDVDGSPLIRPGDLLCGDVAVPGSAGLAQVGPLKGRPQYKYTIQLRRCSTRSAGNALELHIRKILQNAPRWKQAMGAHLVGTHAWSTASKHVMDSYMVGGIMMVGELMAAGELVPTAQGDAIAGNPAAAQQFTQLRESFGDIGTLTDENRVVARKAADQYMLHLATHFRLLRNESLDNGKAEVRKRLGQVRVDTLNRTFHDACNPYYEFGIDLSGVGVVRSIAKHPRNGQVDAGSAAGQFLLQQLNHFRRGVSGFQHAVTRELSTIVGRAATGGNPGGSGNVHVFLGRY